VTFLVIGVAGPVPNEFIVPGDVMMMLLVSTLSSGGAIDTVEADASVTGGASPSAQSHGT
jgi:hypothetical protein